MEQDTRIGLALGILLMGVVAALFFRNEPASNSEAPEMADSESLDAQIAERPIAPYLEPKRRVPPASPEVLAHNAQRAGGLTGRTRHQARSAAAEPVPIPRQKREIHIAPTPPPNAPRPRIARNTPKTQFPAVELESAAKTVRSPEDVEARSVAPEMQEYEVLPGDTLSDISEKFLGSSSRYMEIFELNRDRLRTPHDLRTGRRILVPRVRR